MTRLQSSANDKLNKMADIPESSYEWRVRIDETNNLTELLKLEKQFNQEGIQQIEPYEIPGILNAFDSRKKDLGKI